LQSISRYSTPVIVEIVDCVKIGFLLNINVPVADFTWYSNNSRWGSKVA